MKKTKKFFAYLLSFNLLLSSMLIPTYANQDFRGDITIMSEDNLDETSLFQSVSNEEAVYPTVFDETVRSNLFNDNWKFRLGDLSNAHTKEFNDSTFRELNLPHDYSIEQEFSASNEAESGYLPGGTAWYRKTFTLPQSARGKKVRIDFDGVYMDASVYINGHLLGMHPYGYTNFSFDLTDYIDFDGQNVLAVKVEHKVPSSRWYSGSGIYRDVYLTITNETHVDLDGVVVTYTGLENNRENVETTVKTTVYNDANTGKTIKLRHRLYFKDELITTYETTANEIEANSKEEIIASFSVSNPTLWDLDNPNLYTLKTEILQDTNVLDSIDTDFGYRYYNFDANNGFSLNGTDMKLKGVCMHHDQGALGAVANKTAMRRQINILKDMGCNSIRITHNPGAKEFVKACDELGILVIEEAFDGWRLLKNTNTFDYARYFESQIPSDNKILGKKDNMTWAEFDLKAMIKRDINSASTIMWSLGNEVLEGSAFDSNYDQVMQRLVNWSKEVDDNRLVTAGDNKLKREDVRNTQNVFYRMNEVLHNGGGVVGLNYAQGHHYDSWHRQKPDWKIVASETSSAINSRGVYKRRGYSGTQNAAKELTAYDESVVGWGLLASASWYEVIKRDFVAGEYIWTGFDYIGEPTPWNGTGRGSVGSWPAPKNSFFGIIDTAGFPKDTYYLYRSLWNDKDKTLHVLPAWNEDVVEADGQRGVPIVVYSNAKSVRLFFTPTGGERRDLGLKTFTTFRSNGNKYTYQLYQGEDKRQHEHKNLYLTWYLPFEPGTLEAKAYSDEAGLVEIENTVGRKIVKTTKEAKKIRLNEYNPKDEVLYADGRDLLYLEADVTDIDGNIVPNAENRIKFSVEGPAEIVGVDNGSAKDHDPYKADNKRTTAGKVLVILQTKKEAGQIRVVASSDGLESASFEKESVSTQETSSDVSNKHLVSYIMSKNYYVKKGNKPVLPNKIKAKYSDGSIIEKDVTWDEISDDSINEIGNFNIKGTLEDGEVFVNISIIEKIAALLNYSTSTPIGVKAILPETRPAVLSNAQVLNLAFPVNWEDDSEVDYNSVGIKTIQGTSRIFGEEIQVKATIRVQEESVTLAQSVSPQAADLTEEIEGGSGSDTLNAIKDGRTTKNANTSGGRNTSIWSNYAAAQNEINEAKLTFRYDTQVRLGEIKIHFAKDSGSLRYPDPNTTEIYVSEDGESYTRLNAREVIAANERDSVKIYTYEFAPTTFTFIKFVVRNSILETPPVKKASIGITEIELKPAIGNYITHSSTNIDSLNINSNELTRSQLSKNEYSTEATVIRNLEYSSNNNEAFTYVEDLENEKAYLIIESEDNKRTRVFTINLGSDVSSDADPTNDALDVPVEKIVNVSAGNFHNNNHSPNNVKDSNPNSLWHTRWQGGYSSPLSERWIELELDEATKIDALRYYARGGSSNGRVNRYKVQVSEDGISYKDVATGNFENTEGYKIATFPPVLAKKIKLIGETTYGDGNQANRFMSAGEIRVRKEKEKIDLLDPANNITINIDKDEYLLDEIKEPIKPVVTVKKGEETLEYGIDYKVLYRDNTNFGTAYVIVKGIIDYTGEFEIPFTIKTDNLYKLTVENSSIYSVNDVEIDESVTELLIEKGQRVIIIGEEENFKKFEISPNTLNITEFEEAVFEFTMPEHSLLVKGIYHNEEKLPSSSYVSTLPNDWYAEVSKEKLDELFDRFTSEEEKEEVKANKRIDISLVLNKKSELVEDITLNSSDNDKISVFSSMRDRAAELRNDNNLSSFYIEPKLLKKIFEDASSETFTEEILDEEVRIPIGIEVPKRGRKMDNYVVLEYNRNSNEINILKHTVDNTLLNFELATNAVYGVFYDAKYNVRFVDYNDNLISSEKVSIGNLPTAPQNPNRSGYTFVSWDKDITKAFYDKTYKAIYKRDASSGSSSGSYGGIIRNNASSSKGFSGKSYNNSWILLSNKSWAYRLGDGSLAKSRWLNLKHDNQNRWYYFDDNSTMLTGWFKDVHGRWFYLRTVDNSNIGIMYTGWRWIKSKDGKERCYYFAETKDENEGSLAVSQIVDGKWTVNENGVWTVNGIEQVR